MTKQKVFAIQNTDGLYLSSLFPVDWHADLGLSYKYNIELIAEDVARQLGAKVISVMVPLAPPKYVAARWIPAHYPSSAYWIIERESDNDDDVLRYAQSAIGCVRALTREQFEALNA